MIILTIGIDTEQINFLRNDGYMLESNEAAIINQTETILALERTNVEIQDFQEVLLEVEYANS